MHAARWWRSTQLATLLPSSPLRARLVMFWFLARGATHPPMRSIRARQTPHHPTLGLPHGLSEIQRSTRPRLVSFLNHGQRVRPTRPISSHPRPLCASQSHSTKSKGKSCSGCGHLDAEGHRNPQDRAHALPQTGMVGSGKLNHQVRPDNAQKEIDTSCCAVQQQQPN